MATRMSKQVPRPDTIRPDVVYAAYLEQQILLGFSNLCPSYPEVLNGWNRSTNTNIEGSGKQPLPGGGSKDLGVVCHALPKVSEAINEFTLDQQHV